MDKSLSTDFNLLVRMLLSDEDWIRSRAIYFVEQQLSPSVDKAVIRELIANIEAPRRRAPKETRELLHVLQQFLDQTSESRQRVVS